MTNQKIIDSHTHIYPPAIADRATQSLGQFYDFCVHGKGTYDDLEEQANACGVSGFFLLAVATNAHQVQKVNDHVAQAVALSRAHGFETAGFAGMHQDYTDFEAELQRCREMGLCGVKIHPDIQRMDLESKQMYALCEVMEGKMPLFLHMGDARPEYRYSAPAKLAKLLCRFPRLTVVAAHFGGYMAWEEAESCLFGAPNVWYDTSSALWAMSPERACELIERCGYDRVMFGSDYPVYNLGAYLELFNRLDLDSERRDAILYGNAHRFLQTCAAQ